MITTIQIDSTTRNRLKELGKKGETYEDIVLRLLDYWGDKGNDGSSKPKKKYV